MRGGGAARHSSSSAEPPPAARDCCIAAACLQSRPHAYGAPSRRCWPEVSSRLRDQLPNQANDVPKFLFIGLFDMDKTAENIHREIVNGLNMARDGIHVILMVFSATCRFSQEDEKTVEAAKMFLGDKVLDHMILVFTHGDLVGEETSWNKKLTDSAPAYLQDMLNLCKNRVVLFDNKTSNKKYRLAQLRKLLDAVDFVISSNHGKPFSNCTHAHSQKMQSRREISAEDYSTEQRFKLKKEIYDECVAQVVKMVEENPISTVTRFEKLLLEEHKARLESDNRAAEVILKSEEETRKVKEMLQKINKESENAQKEMEKVKKKVRTLEKIHENKK